MIKLRKEVPMSKPSSKVNYTIPNEYLSPQKRTIKEGLDGKQQRLRRDKIEALRLLRGGSRSNDRHLNHDTSVATI